MGNLFSCCSSNPTSQTNPTIHVDNDEVVLDLENQRLHTDMSNKQHLTPIREEVEEEDHSKNVDNKVDAIIRENKFEQIDESSQYAVGVTSAQPWFAIKISVLVPETISNIKLL